MSLTILVADDDVVVRTILTAIFDSVQIDGVFCESGTSFINELARRKETANLPDVIFLDMLLQDLTGLEVKDKISELLGETHNIPVVLLSSNSKGEILANHPDKTIDYFLQKPFTPKSLTDLLKTTLKVI